MIDKKTNAEMVYSSDPRALLEEAMVLHKRRIAEHRAYLVPPPDG